MPAWMENGRWEREPSIHLAEMAVDMADSLTDLAESLIDALLRV
jgi:hypothetical protein